MTSRPPAVPETGLIGIERFAVVQKAPMMVNRYDVRAVDADGRPATVLAVAQQKRMSFKESVTFCADESRSIPVCSFKARTAMDLAAT